MSSATLPNKSYANASDYCCVIGSDVDCFDTYLHKHAGIDIEELKVENAFEYIAGGAVRDYIRGEDPSDIDMYYTNKTKYINMIFHLTAEGYECKDNGISFWGEKKKLIRSRWSNKRSPVSLDVMFVDCNRPQLMGKFKNEFDFTVNSGYYDGKNIEFASSQGKENLLGNVVEVSNRNMVFEQLIVRASHMKSKGFNIGPSVVSQMVEKADGIFDGSTERSDGFVNFVGAYARRKVKSKNILNEMFNLIDDDNMIIALTGANTDEILKHAQKEHNRRIVPKKGFLDIIFNRRLIDGEDS